jgi:anti-sigma B factor antagonist
MDYLLVHEYHEGETTVLAAHGDLDAHTGAHLADRLAALAAAGRHRLILDAAGLTFCDTHGIRIMISAHVRARDQGGWLRLVRADWRIRKLLSILPALAVPEAFESITDALAGPPTEAGEPTPTPRPR